MRTAVARSVKTWLSGVIQDVDVRKPATVHLDELLGDLYTPQGSLGLALDAYCVLAAHVTDLYAYMPVLVIPLPPTKTMRRSPPSWGSLAGSVFYEPPALYVLSRDSKKLVSHCEEYRFPLEPPNPVPPDGISVAYYRVFRSILGVENNWEFERCVYVETYTPELDSMNR